MKEEFHTATANCNNNSFLVFGVLILALSIIIASRLNPSEAWAAVGTSSTMTTSSSSSSTRNNGMQTCTDVTYKFTIKYPFNWTKSPAVGRCTLFGPSTLNEIFPDPNQTYVRISATNDSVPFGPSDQDLGHNIDFLTDHSNFQKTGGPGNVTINGTNGVELDYRWTGSPQIALPFVNQFSVLATRSEVNQPPAGNQSSILGNFLPSHDTSKLTSDNGTKAPKSTNGTKPTNGTKAAPTPPNPFSKVLAAFYIVKYNKVYVIEYNAPEAKFNYYVPTVRAMINSFGFTR